MQPSDPILNVSDLRQLIYCPRIVYYTWVVPVHPPGTFLMERGQRLEEDFERLEPRRLLGHYGFSEAQRRFGVVMTDPALGLTGQADLVLEGPDRVAVVEFKATPHALGENQKVQLCGYALLAEEHFQRASPVGFALLADRKELVAVEFDEPLRAATLSALGKAQAIVREQAFPPRTPVRTRCAQCEFRNFCGDVF